MKRIIILFMLFSFPAFAHDITQPPVMTKQDKVLIDYLKTIADNYNTISVVTTSPNGNITGQKGHLLIYNNALYCNTDGLKTWVKVGP